MITASMKFVLVIIYLAYYNKYSTESPPKQKSLFWHSILGLSIHGQLLPGHQWAIHPKRKNNTEQVLMLRMGENMENGTGTLSSPLKTGLQRLKDLPMDSVTTQQCPLMTKLSHLNISEIFKIQSQAWPLKSYRANQPQSLLTYFELSMPVPLQGFDSSPVKQKRDHGKWYIGAQDTTYLIEIAHRLGEIIECHFMLHDIYQAIALQLSLSKHNKIEQPGKT